MERSRVALITAVLFAVFSSQTRISGAHMEMSVRPGDDVTLYCDTPTGPHIVWFRNCSHENQPPLVLESVEFLSNRFRKLQKHFQFVENSSSQTFDLLVKNVSEKDLGVYYCGKKETEFNNGERVQDFYLYGTQTTRLSLTEKPFPSVTVSPNTTAPHEPRHCVSWQLLVSVSAVCVLLSSFISSVCVYRLCRNTTEAEVKADPGSRDTRRTQRRDEAGGDEVCYASLDARNLKKKKKMRVKPSEFSTYSEVRFNEAL